MTDYSDLERLRDAGTAGEWCWDRTTINAHIHQVGGLHYLASCVIGQSDWHEPDLSESVANAALIVAAVNAVKPMLADLRAKDARIEALVARIAELEAERDRVEAILRVGEVFLDKCNSAWACGEPLHRVQIMLHAAANFRAALDTRDTDNGE